MKPLGLDADRVPRVYRITVTSADGELIETGSTQCLESDVPGVIARLSAAFTEAGHTGFIVTMVPA